MNASPLMSRTASSGISDAPPCHRPIPPGTRFCKAGHWWEVEATDPGCDELFLNCRPVCSIENRLFSQAEIWRCLQAADAQFAGDRSRSSCDRGSGRITAVDPVPPKLSTLQKQLQSQIRASYRRGSGRITASLTTPAQPQPGQATTQSPETAGTDHETVRLLVLGSKPGVLKTIQHLHSLRYAKSDEWSPLQPGKKKGEYLSILIQKVSTATPRAVS